MTDRVCACGCGASMNGARPQARYASDACRSRAWKARNDYRLVRARKPRQTRKREGLSVYFPTLADAEYMLIQYEDYGEPRDHPAYQALARAIDRRKARP